MFVFASGISDSILVFIVSEQIAPEIVVILHTD